MKTVFLAAFCFAAWSCSVFAGEAEEKKIGVLPGDMIVHIRTGQIENTLQNIEEFLVEAVRGTPLMMQMQPGMLKTVLPLQLGLPLELFDTTKSVEIAVCNPDFANNDAATGFVVPFANFDDLKKNGAAIGLKLEEEEGAFKLGFINQGKTAYVADAGNGYVVISEKAAHARHLAEIYLENPPHAAPTEKNAACFTITVDVEKILTLNAPLIDAGMQNFQRGIEEGKYQATLPPQFQGLLKLAPLYLNTLNRFGNTIKSLRTYVYASSSSLRLSGFVTPQADTLLRKTADLYEPTAPEYELAKLLPRESALAMGFNMNKEALQPVQDSIFAIFAEILKSLQGEGEPEFKLADMQKMIGLQSGDQAFAMVPYVTEKETGATTVVASTTANGKEYQELLKPVFAETGTLLNQFYKLLGLPCKLTFSLKEAARQTGDGTPVGGVSIGIERIEPKEGQQEMNDFMFALIKKQLDRFQEEIAIVDNTCVVTTGTGYAPTLDNTVKSLKDKQPGIGQRPEFAESLKAAESAQMAFGVLYLLDTAKAAVMESAHNNPAITEVMVNVAKTVPNSTEPVILTLGAQKGSYKWTTRLTTKAISETAVAVMGAYMKFMMMNQAQQNQAQPNPQPAPTQKAPPEAF
jgi:hypothetical protein